MNIYYFKKTGGPVTTAQLCRVTGPLFFIRMSAGIIPEDKACFLTVAMFAHGYASIIASNGLAYDEELIAEHLEYAWNGAVLAAGQEDTE